MKSHMIETGDYITNKSGYSDLQVLQSAVGWYIGTIYSNYDTNGNHLYDEPGSRDSVYFPTKEKAEEILSVWENDPSILWKKIAVTHRERI